MRTLILFSILTFTGFSVKSQTSTLEDVRNRALSDCRAFRKEINKLNNVDVNTVDSLKLTLSSVIEATKTVTDTLQLNAISSYFSIQKDFFSDRNSLKNKEDLENAVRDINKDILYKISSSRDTSLNLNGMFHFAGQKEIIVTVFINGEKQDKGLYRLFWAPLRGKYIDPSKYNSFKGSSNNFSNPYKLKIILPANYITFWLIDTQTNIIYTPDTDYKSLIDIDTSIDILFKKIK